MAGIIEQLKCPVCLEIPEGKVFQCKNGHTFCGGCSTKLKTCPQCRIPFAGEKIRNRTLEQLLDVVDFKCPNKELGCAKVLKRFEILSHLKFCKFEPFYFCRLIGFQHCSLNVDKTDLTKNLFKHFQDFHPEVCETSGKRLTIKYDNFFGRICSLEKKSFTVWTPHFVRFSNGGEEIVLLFLCQVSEITRNVAWVCLSMMNDCDTEAVKHESILRVEYNLGSTRSKDLLVPKMTWKAPILPFKNIEKDLENYALRIPISVLDTFHLTSETKNLEMRITILEENNEKQENSDLTGSLEILTSEPVVITELTTFVSDSFHTTFNDDSTDGGVLFENVFCNSCYQRPLVCVRFKCLQCIDYDLCKTCMKHKIHSHHVFAHIQDLQQNSFFNLKQRVRQLRGKSGYI